MFATPTAAQQQSPDLAAAQRLLTAIETQRNQALTQHAYAEARAAGMVDELARANARIKELEPKPEPDKDSKP